MTDNTKPAAGPGRGAANADRDEVKVKYSEFKMHYRRLTVGQRPALNVTSSQIRVNRVVAAQNLI
jgi:hypothetical protein